jgi:hypothetical protein
MRGACPASLPPYFRFFSFFAPKQIRACVALLDIAMEETKSADVNEHFDRFMYVHAGVVVSAARMRFKRVADRQSLIRLCF